MTLLFYEYLELTSTVFYHALCHSYEFLYHLKVVAEILNAKKNCVIVDLRNLIDTIEFQLLIGASISSETEFSFDSNC